MVPESRFSVYMKDALIVLCICWHALNSYSNTLWRGKASLVSETVFSVSRENINLRIVISLGDSQAQDAGKARAK